MDNNIPPSDDQNNIEQPQNYSGQDSGDELYKNKPSVGNNRKKLIVVGTVLLGFAGYMLYNIFAPAPKEKAIDITAGQGAPKGTSSKGDNDSLQASINKDLPQPPVVTLQPPPPPIEASPIFTPPPIVSPPTISPQTLPSTIENAVPPPPPPPPATPPATISKIGGSKATDKNEQKRIRSNMLIIDGGKADKDGSAAVKTVSNDPNSNFANSIIRETTAEKATATGLSNLNMTIAQGKVIDAVLETAINTDLPGSIRAIVSRDTFAEAGRDVLIPKGSRLIGTYNTGVLHGQNRVMIVWIRVIRPDGIDIMIGSPAINNLGQAGIEGFVDNKFMEIFTGAVLSSVLTIGAAVGVEAVLPTKGTTTTTPEGNSTSNTSPTQQAAAQAVTDLGSTAKDVVDKFVNTRPTVKVDQGTRIGVFVNRDLTFPSTFEGNVFIP